MTVIRRIVSGGQTGADRAAFDVALDLGIDCGGWVPRGRLAEDGVIPDRYTGLEEAPDDIPATRTALNVRDSDGTLILSHGVLTGGSRLTAEKAKALGKPCLHVDLAVRPFDEAADDIRQWLASVRPATLNIAGPRASKDAGIYAATRAVLEAVLR